MGARTTSGPVHPGVRGPPRPVGRELYAKNLPTDVGGRPPVDVLEQRVIDQRLVVAAASLVDHVPEILKYTVVEANRDLRFPRLRLDDGAAPRAREIYVAISLSHGLLHRAPSAACLPSTRKLPELCSDPSTRIRPPAASPRRSARA